MVLTGVEIVGIVLAVVPLCITALEHHQDEIRPFKMLLSYKTQAQKARHQFGIVHTRFRQVIELVVLDLALSQRQSNMMLRSLHGTVDARVWSSDEAEQALMDHFGARDYRTGFLPLVQTILANLKDISDILSLDLTCASNSAQGHWDCIDVARTRLECQCDQRKTSKQSMKELERKVASRAKLVFKSGTLDPKREELDRNIRMLDDMSRDARDLSPVRVPMPRFRWPLMDLRRYASSLYQSLQAVRTCDKHNSHCVNLQLDCRLKDNSRTKVEASPDDKPSFKVALAPTTDSSVWYALHVDIITETSTPWRASQRVRFLQNPMKTKRMVTKGICATISTCPDVSFGVDSQNSLHEMSADPSKAVGTLSSIAWVSMRKMLHDQTNSSKHIAELDYAQIMSLGLTLVCSFLQLYLTNWVSDAWDAADVMFLQKSSSIDYDSAYIQLNMLDATTNATLGSRTPAVERKLVALASVLLELGTLRTMTEWRLPTDSDELATIRRCVSDGELDGEPPCFREAIDYCLAHHNSNLDLAQPSAEMLQEIAGAVVAPFQRDLRSAKMAVPP